MEILLSNNWFIGITSSIISAIFLYIVTTFITKFLNRENINKANCEVINILKPYVVDLGLPNEDVLKSIISSTARKYKVHPEQMYTIIILCEEIIKEITESIYVTSEKKQEYNEALVKYKKNIEKNGMISYGESIEEKGFNYKMFFLSIVVIAYLLFLYKTFILIRLRIESANINGFFSSLNSTSKIVLIILLFLIFIKILKIRRRLKNRRELE